ncbi:Putative LOC100569581, partial [Caligus rogercresseyi]
EWIEASGLKDLEKVVRLRELPLESRDALEQSSLDLNPHRADEKEELLPSII